MCRRGHGIRLILREGRTAAAAKLICAAPEATGCSIASRLSKGDFRAVRRGWGGDELAGIWRAALTVRNSIISDWRAASDGLKEVV
jgi:hypothetical protein